MSDTSPKQDKPFDFPPLDMHVTRNEPADNGYWPVHPAIKGNAAPFPRVTGKTAVPELDTGENDDE